MPPTTKNFPKLAEEIRALRARRDMSQDELARQIGMHPSTLTKRIKTPGDFTITELSRLAFALQADWNVDLAGTTVAHRSRLITKGQL